MMFFMVAVVLIGLLIVGIAFMQSRKMNKKGMFRDILLGYLGPSLLFIGFIEFVVVPDTGAQKAALLYPLFIVCWIAPVSLLMNRRIKKYNS